nr:glycoside hydrolase family 125 protein [uncultured Prevotella sp.]
MKIRKIVGLILVLSAFSINHVKAVPNLYAKRCIKESFLRTNEERVVSLVSCRPPVSSRLFRSAVIDGVIRKVQKELKGNPYLSLMFENCFPNTLDTTVHYGKDAEGNDDTFVYTGDIHAMWLRDSGAQVWPYVQFANRDKKLKALIRGVINRQFWCINIDPYANAFNAGSTGSKWDSDETDMKPELHERKYEIDSLCYPIRLAYYYWQVTGDTSVFGPGWLSAIRKILKTFREQQRKSSLGPYRFQRNGIILNKGYGSPVKPVGLIASLFRPSDDATTFLFLVPSNFMAVSSLRKASEILDKVNNRQDLVSACTSLAGEVETALHKYAVYDHPKYGKIYAYEVDGFGNHLLMDDANAPSLLSMGYMDPSELIDPVYQNTRHFVLSEDNPYFFRGKVADGIGSPHTGFDMIWPISIIMRAMTSTDDAEIRKCIEMLMRTDAGTGFMHESFNKDNPLKFTRPWFSWADTLFGELIMKLVDEGKVNLLNSVKR